MLEQQLPQHQVVLVVVVAKALPERQHPLPRLVRVTLAVVEMQAHLITVVVGVVVLKIPHR
jgi:hypothetical protein